MYINYWSFLGKEKKSTNLNINELSKEECGEEKVATLKWSQSTMAWADTP
jgi:hypothetical protein